jgi:hypothetical protein
MSDAEEGETPRHSCSGVGVFATITYRRTIT